MRDIKSRTNQFCQFCKWLENLLSSSVKQHSQSPFDFNASFQSINIGHCQPLLKWSSNEWSTTASQSYDYDAEAKAFLVQVYLSDSHFQVDLNNL